VKVKKYIYVVEGCTFCGACLYECGYGAISMTESGAFINQEKCTACGKCYENCPHGAIHKRTIEENT
jgi:ferredoxin